MICRPAPETIRQLSTTVMMYRMNLAKNGPVIAIMQLLYLQDVPDGDADSISHEVDASFDPVFVAVAGRREKSRAEEPWALEERHECCSGEADGGAGDLGDAPQASDIHFL